jgi:peroxin-19
LPSAPPPTAFAATTFSPGPDLASPGEIPDEEDLAANLADDFASELAKGMESLMREIGGGAGLHNPGEGNTEEQKEQEREFRAIWESLLIQGREGSGPSSDLPGGTGKEKAKDTSEGEGAFQQSIRQTMDKLKQSESTLQVCHSFTTDRFPSDSLRVSLGRLVVTEHCKRGW